MMNRSQAPKDLAPRQLDSCIFVCPVDLSSETAARSSNTATSYTEGGVSIALKSERIHNSGSIYILI